MTKVRSFLVLMVAVTVMLMAPVMFVDARAGEKEKSTSLRAVMKKLGRDMQAVTGAISNEDWPLVVELAPEIAHHQEPPMIEKVHILRWLGTDASTFRGFDGQIKAAANDMGEAAARVNGKEVIRAFSDVQQACLGCHQQFRKSFIEHFYSQL